MKDEVFNKAITKQFEFDEEVAAVFDDMLRRSVPFYAEAMALCETLAVRYLSEGGRLYDLGCSTATLLLAIERRLDAPAELIGIDNSEAMLAHARKKIDIYRSGVRVVEGDILAYDYQCADVMVSNYTLQFVRPPVRETLVAKITSALKPGGAFIFSEKVVTPDSRLNKTLIDVYYDFKKSQGYSEYEIMQKREALENVLIPYTAEENVQMAKRCGFKSCETVFRWANFATFIAIKA